MTFGEVKFYLGDENVKISNERLKAIISEMIRDISLEICSLDSSSDELKIFWCFGELHALYIVFDFLEHLE